MGDCISYTGSCQDVMPAMFCYGLYHMSIQEFTECYLTRKMVGLCAVMSMWLVHIKEHVWSVGTCPTTVLLSMSRLMCKVLHWRAEWKKRYGLAWKANLYAPQGVDLGGGGSPLNKWNDTEWKVARAAKSCETHSIILQVFYSALYQVPNFIYFF